MNRRHVDVVKFIRSLRTRLLASDSESLEFDEVIDKVKETLQGQPKDPDLIGPSVVAEMLGIQPTHVSRMVQSGRLPQPILVEGSNRAFYREEIEAVRVQREKEAAEREERKKTGKSEKASA